MSNLILIVLARAIHVVAGVLWTGGAFVLATVIVPLATLHAAEGASSWLGMAARRAGRLTGISALPTILSGIYLFAALHPHDDSASGLVLKSGAAAALLSLAVGLLIGRPAGIKLARLQDAHWEGSVTSTDATRQLAGLRLRAALSTRLAAGMLLVAVAAMSVFRYASALA